MSIARIDKIVGVRPQPSRNGTKGYITTAIVDGDEVSGWSKDKFQVGDLVGTFFDDRFNKAKMMRLPRRQFLEDTHNA